MNDEQKTGIRLKKQLVTKRVKAHLTAPLCDEVTAMTPWHGLIAWILTFDIMKILQ